MTALMDEKLDYIKCAVMYNSVMLDWDSNLGIEGMAKQIGFAYPEKVKPFTS